MCIDQMVNKKTEFKGTNSEAKKEHEPRDDVHRTKLGARM